MLKTAHTQPAAAAPPAGRFDARDALTLALCAGTARLFFEWTLGGGYPLFPISDLAMSAATFWLALSAYLAVLSFSARLPWRDAWPAAAALTALGALPPPADAALGVGKFSYGYLWSFPQGFSWTLYQPDAGISPGEAGVMWVVVFAAGWFAWSRTAAPGRALLAAALAYATQLLLFGGVPALAEWIRVANDWPPDHRRTLFTLLQVAAAAGAYLLMNRMLVRGLMKRIHHALPFVACCVAGSSFAGGIFPATFAYAAALLAVFVLWLLQNDLHDAADDARQGREPYLVADDVQYFTYAAGFLIVTLASVNTGAVLPLVAVAVTSTLYSLPFYRAKRYFPSNLKMEGLWGAASFSLGAVAAAEHAAYGAPRWWLGIVPEPKSLDAVGYFATETLVATLLVFGGFSLVAVLKDYKDWEADLAARVQTVYTLAARSGRPLAPLHRALTWASAGALALSGFLAAAAGKMAWGYTPGGILAGGLVAAFMLGAPSEARFRRTLYVFASYFGYLAVAFGRSGA